MNKNYLNFLSNYNPIVSFSETIFQSSDNTNDDISKSITININNLDMLDNINNDINNTFSNLMYTYNKIKVNNQIILDYKTTIVNDDIIFNIKLDDNFLFFLKETINNKGYLKILNVDNICIYTVYDLYENVSNVLLRDNNIKLKSIPLKDINNDIFITNIYSLNFLKIEIPINKKINILNDIIEDVTDKFNSSKTKSYKISFKLKFECINNNGKIANWGDTLQNSIINKNYITDNFYNISIIIKNVPIVDNFINKINNGLFKRIIMSIK